MPKDNPPAFEIVDAAYAFLGILHDLGEEEGKCGGGDFGITALVQRPIIDIWARAGLGSRCCLNGWCRGQ